MNHRVHGQNLDNNIPAERGAPPTQGRPSCICVATEGAPGLLVLWGCSLGADLLMLLVLVGAEAEVAASWELLLLWVSGEQA